MASRVRSPLDETDHFLVQRLEGSERDRPLYDRLRRNGRGSQRLNRRQRIASASKGLKVEQAKYRKLAAVFLSQPENKWCVCCTLRREVLGENILRNQSAEIHHWAGRIKRLLCYVPYFRAFCYHCREWPHQNPEKARELNILAPAHLWEVYPGDY